MAFLGVFDRVAAMGGIHRRGEKIVTDVVFDNGSVDRRVKRAVHILSLDEDRVAFEPTQISDSDRIRSSLNDRPSRFESNRPSSRRK